MKTKIIYTVLALFLPIIIFAQDAEIIKIARKVYQKPYYQDIYRDYLPPKIIEMKCLDLPPEKRKAIKNDPTDLWREAENGRAFYIVTFPIDMEKDTIFEQQYGAQVYIWKDNKKPFIIRTGTQSINAPADYEGDTPAGTPNPSDNKTYTVTYSRDTPLKTTAIRSAKYGDIITITYSNTVVENPNDGWTTEEYYELNSVKNGQLLSKTLTDSSEGKSNSYYKTYELKFMVRGNLVINMSKIREEYEGWVN